MFKDIAIVLSGIITIGLMSSCQNSQILNDPSKRDPATANFSDQNFLKCQEIYAYTISNAAAADKCADLVKQGYKFVKNKNFEICYGIYASTLLNAEAADKCISYSNFDFTENKQFLSCQGIYAYTITNAEAADKCIELINQGVKVFRNDSFLKCQKIYAHTISNAAAADRCISELSKK